MKKEILITVLALFGVMAIFAQEYIAVFPFEVLDNAITQNESFQLYQVFSNEFRNRKPSGIYIVPRQDVDRLINTEARFQLSVFSAQAKTAEMMQVKNATQILSGVIGKVGNRINITVSLYTYPSLDPLLGGTSLHVTNSVELLDKMPELVQDMLNKMAGGGSGQFIPAGLLYEIDNYRTVTITRYIGNAVTLNIPSYIQGLPVTAISEIAKNDEGKGGDDWEGPGYWKFTSITIPSSVRSIGRDAFGGCRGLTTITVDNRNPAYASLDGALFDKNIRTLIRYPIGRNQRTYVIPSSVTSIGDYAFISSSLTSVTIPSSVTSIGDRVFSNCSSLTSVTIPSSVTSIGEGAFSNCYSLTSVTIPSSITSIGNWAFVSSGLTSLTISSSVRSIGQEAFAYCSSLTNVIIPSSVTSIGNWAFRGCNSLTSVTLSRHTQLGNNVFPANARIIYRD